MEIIWFADHLKESLEFWELLALTPPPPPPPPPPVTDCNLGKFLCYYWGENHQLPGSIIFFSE